MNEAKSMLITAMAHGETRRSQALKVRSVIRERAEQYAENLTEASKRLDASEGDALDPKYNSGARLGLTRLRGVLDSMKNS